MTNYERIKNMSIEEMAGYLNGIFDCCNCPNDMFLCESKGNVCTKYIKQWLESEAETKMTDNEIFETEIKCINRRANGKCNGGTDCCKCDLLMNEKDIISAYERAIANNDLINKQQAEIEKLERTISYLESVCESIPDKIRVEAIKEFWGKLKKHSRKMQSSDFSGEFWDRAVLVEDGDNILKEMVVETE